MSRDVQNMKWKIKNHRSVPTANKSRCDTIITSASKHNFYKNHIRYDFRQVLPLLVQKNIFEHKEEDRK